MKRLFAIACVMVAVLAPVSAQHLVNPMFDDKGSARIKATEFSEQRDTIIDVFALCLSHHRYALQAELSTLLPDSL